MMPTLYWKEKQTTDYKKESFKLIYLINIAAKILSKSLGNLIQQYMKRIIYHDKVEFISEMQGWFNIHKSINVAHLINKTKDQIIWLPLDTEKACGEKKKKTLNKVGI